MDGLLVMIGLLGAGYLVAVGLEDVGRAIREATQPEQMQPKRSRDARKAGIGRSFIGRKNGKSGE